MADPPLTISLLGPPRFERGGATVLALRSPLPRALLTCLILAGAPVERGLLCGLFWPDMPEARARQNLRVALTRLRSALPGRILADRHEVAFSVRADDEVDVLVLRPELEALAAPSRSPRDGRTVQAALDRLRKPLGADLDGPATPDFRAWLSERRADWDVLVTAALAGLAKPDPTEATASPQALYGAQSPEDGGWLGETLRRNPLAEPLARQHMLDLARRGSHDAALAEHARLSAALGATLGLGPDAATEALRARIVKARGRGRRHNLPSLSLDSAASSVEAGPGGIAQRLSDWLTDSNRRLVSLIGVADPLRRGIACQAAWLALDSLLDGILWVPPREEAAGAPLAVRLVGALGQLDGAACPVTQVTEHLAPLERLVVLDGIDAEPGAVDAVERWLDAAPASRWLVLSTAPLGFVFEHRFRLED